MPNKRQKMKVVGVATIENHKRKILNLVADNKYKKHGMPHLRAGSMHYSLHDDGQLKKVHKILIVVLEVPEHLEFEEMSESNDTVRSKIEFQQARPTKNTQSEQVDNIGKMHFLPSYSLCNSQFKAIYKQCYKAMKSVARRRR